MSIRTEKYQYHCEDDDGPYLAAVLGLEQLLEGRLNRVHLAARIVHLVPQLVQQHVLLLHLLVNGAADLAEPVDCLAEVVEVAVLHVDNLLRLQLLVLDEPSVLRRRRAAIAWI